MSSLVIIALGQDVIHSWAFHFVAGLVFVFLLSTRVLSPTTRHHCKSITLSVCFLHLNLNRLGPIAWPSDLARSGIIFVAPFGIVNLSAPLNRYALHYFYLSLQVAWLGCLISSPVPESSVIGRAFDNTLWFTKFYLLFQYLSNTIQNGLRLSDKIRSWAKIIR
jgi:hypothetical protein